MGVDSDYRYHHLNTITIIIVTIIINIFIIINMGHRLLRKSTSCYDRSTTIPWDRTLEVTYLSSNPLQYTDF